LLLRFFGSILRDDRPASRHRQKCHADDGDSREPPQSQAGRFRQRRSRQALDAVGEGPSRFENADQPHVQLQRSRRMFCHVDQCVTISFDRGGKRDQHGVVDRLFA
jgi:hypothetical protein